MFNCLNALFLGGVNRLEPHERMETLEEKIARVVKEDVAVVPYDSCWPAMFEQERLHLLACLPDDLILRIEHFGSTAVPGFPAKPIVDILVEVVSLDETRQRIVPILESQGYDYFWRPSLGENTPPFSTPGLSNVTRAGIERITSTWLSPISISATDCCSGTT